MVLLIQQFKKTIEGSSRFRVKILSAFGGKSGVYRIPPPSLTSSCFRLGSVADLERYICYLVSALVPHSLVVPSW
jgi:hypothetical protein